MPGVELTERFADLVTREHVPLDEAVLLVGAHGDPSADLAAARGRLDELAASVGGADLGSLLTTLFTTEDFHGAGNDYYDPRNSYLHLVLERRVGLPITLSVVLMEVGRRVGVDLVGIAAPAHFVTRLSSDADCYVDAFRGGRVLDRDGLDELFSTMAPGVDIEPFLRPVGSVDIVRRVLNNLVAVHRSRGDRDGLRWSTELRTVLPDASADDHRAFGGALAASGDYARAAKILESLADRHLVSDPAGTRVEAQRLRARLN